MAGKVRSRNARGDGGKLRAEIVAAAVSLMDSSPDLETPSLRGIARRVGITAPAIYAHFASLDEIDDEVVNVGYGELAKVFRSATRTGGTSSERLYLGCNSYIEYAKDHPARYVLMSHRSPATGVRPQAFPLLVRALRAAIADGSSRSTDPLLDAATLWSGVHGLAFIASRSQQTPWGEDFEVDDILRNLVRGVAKLGD
ncbi:TetR/AcrR family transcriptional regulator [soil metagenome]